MLEFFRGWATGEKTRAVHRRRGEKPDMITTKRMKTSVFSLILIFFVGFPAAAQEKPQPVDQSRLPIILEKTAEYCEKLMGMALNFVCLETIRETEYILKEKRAAKLYPGSRITSIKEGGDFLLASTRKNTLVYDFQLIKKGGDFKEKRTLLEENGRKKNEENVDLKTMRMSSKFLVYGPVGFLSHSWQAHFTYEILGPDTVGKRPARVLRASPRALMDENFNFGKIWVDEKDSSILRIEWEPQSISDFQPLFQSGIGEVKRTISWVVTYNVEKNGVRFPGQQTIREVYLTPVGRSHAKYLAEYSYDRFRFFTVETEVKIK